MKISAALLCIFALFVGLWLGVVTTASNIYSTCKQEGEWSRSYVFVIPEPMHIKCSVDEK